MSTKTIRVPCEEGNVEATRRDSNEPWEIDYPWFSERYYGDVRQVQSRIRATVRRMEEAGK